MTQRVTTTTFRCPYCGLETEVVPRFAGQSGPCAGCGKTVHVPQVPDRIGPAAGRRRADLIRILLLVVPSSAAILLLAYGGYRLLTPAMQSVRRTAARSQCHDRLARIGQALLDYHRQYGHFPPAYSVDSQGRPLHSWRVLILPFLGREAEALYEQIDLTEPWNSAQNVWVGSRVPPVYQCPADRFTGTASSPQDTSYLAIVGPQSVLRPEGRVVADSLRDPTRALMIVESTGSGIHWMEPRDLSVAQLALGINPGTSPSASSRHPQSGAHGLMADGTVLFLTDATDPLQLQTWARSTRGTSSP